jgi:hypothetical protein
MVFSIIQCTVKYKCFLPAATVDNSLLTAGHLCLNAWVQQTFISFHHRTKYATLPLSFILNTGSRCQSGSLLYSALSKPMYSKFPSKLKRRVKRGIANLLVECSLFSVVTHRMGGGGGQVRQKNSVIFLIFRLSINKMGVILLAKHRRNHRFCLWPQ